MKTFSALLAIFAGNSPVTGEFPSQRPVSRGFDVFFGWRLNKRLSKQCDSRCHRAHYDVTVMWRPVASVLHLLAPDLHNNYSNSNNMIGYQYGSPSSGRQYWTGNVILTTFSTLALPEVDKITASCAVSDENTVKITTFPFQWGYSPNCRLLLWCKYEYLSLVFYCTYIYIILIPSCRVWVLCCLWELRHSFGHVHLWLSCRIQRHPLPEL